jgi:hypothetical protein
LLARASYSRGHGDLGMRSGGTRYLLIDDARVASTRLRLDVMAREHVTVFGGWERLRLRHDGESFADVWPFTIWDVFTARRYRLGHLDSRLDTAFLGAGGFFTAAGVDVEMSGRFEWWEDDIDLDWYERVDILFPFYFEYRSHHASPRLHPRYAVQLDARARIPIGERVAMGLCGRATVPFDIGSGDDGNEGGRGGTGGGGAERPRDNEEKSVHGGLTGAVELTVSL